MNSDRGFALVLSCFALSGFAALLYETAWTREFAFVFGTSELAVVMVLAAYMAGLALGAAAAGKLASRVRRPVWVYGLLELGIGVCALAVPRAIGALRSLTVWALGGGNAPLEAGGLPVALFQLAGSFAIVLIPTALMGATLPLLARYAVRSDDQISRRVGALYAANTAGAIGGTLCAAFALLPAIGLRQTVMIGAGTNALVFVLAVWLSRLAPDPVEAPRASVPLAAGRGAWILPLVAVSGFTSFAYEVIWTRLLGHLLGGSVEAFSTMLASFLLGIALGSSVASRLDHNREGALGAFALAQAGIAALTVAAFAAVDGLPALATAVGAGGGGTLAANALIASAVLLPSALCIGATFPLAVRTLARDPGDAARASARVYAWNTAGAIAGAVTAGFVLLPELGFAGAVSAGVAANLVLAAVAALLAGTRRWLPALAAVGLAVLAAAPLPTPWSVLRSSPLGGEPIVGEATYYGVGRSATALLVAWGTDWQLSSNGLPEAIIEGPAPRPGRFLQTRWLGFLPGLVNPDARSLLVVGLGGGVALEALSDRFDSVDVVELEPEIVAANRSIAERRRIDPLSDPRVRVRMNDARSALLLSDARYDAIVSQPSHPWTAGASHLYTREFFELVRERLAPGGALVQWISLRLVDEALLRSLLATLVDVFPAVRVYHPIPNALFFAASRAPLDVEGRAAEALAAAHPIVAELGVRTPEDVAAALALDEEGARRFSEGAPINTDDHNRLAARSPRLGDRALTPGAVRTLFAAHDPLLQPPPGIDPIVLVRRLVVTSGAARATRVAKALADPALRDTAAAWIDLYMGRTSAADRRFASVLAERADVREARIGLLLARRSRAERGDPETLALALPLGGADAATVEGWRRAGAGDWPGVGRRAPPGAPAGPPGPPPAPPARPRAGGRRASPRGSPRPGRGTPSSPKRRDCARAGGSRAETPRSPPMPSRSSIPSFRSAQPRRISSCAPGPARWRDGRGRSPSPSPSSRDAFAATRSRAAPRARPSRS